MCKTTRQNRRNEKGIARNEEDSEEKEKELKLKKQLCEKLRKQKKERRRIKKEMELLRKKRARLDIAITEVRRATQYTVKSQMFVQCDGKIYPNIRFYLNIR